MTTNDSRPAGDGPAEKQTSAQTAISTLQRQLRRRREASARLTPLADGRRDVLDVRPSDGRWL